MVLIDRLQSLHCTQPNAREPGAAVDMIAMDFAFPLHCSCCPFYQVVFNPKDTNTFASASLDRTVKVRAAHTERTVLQVARVLALSVFVCA